MDAIAYADDVALGLLAPTVMALNTFCQWTVSFAREYHVLLHTIKS